MISDVRLGYGQALRELLARARLCSENLRESPEFALVKAYEQVLEHMGLDKDNMMR